MTSSARNDDRDPRRLLRPPPRANRRGFTFTEVAIAIMILALAIVPLTTLLIRETRGTRQSRSRILAGRLAANILERYRVEQVRDLATTIPSMEAGQAAIEEDPLLSPADAPADYKGMMANFRRYVLFEATGERIGTLKAIVRWDEDGFEREIKIGTIIVDADFPGGRP